MPAFVRRDAKSSFRWYLKELEQIRRTHRNLSVDEANNLEQYRYFKSAAGSPLLGNKKVSWFLGSRVYWFLAFKDSKNPLMLSKDSWSIFNLRYD